MAQRVSSGIWVDMKKPVSSPSAWKWVIVVRDLLVRGGKEDVPD